jgi:hypothetical protein
METAHYALMLMNTCLTFECKSSDRLSPRRARERTWYNMIVDAGMTSQGCVGQIFNLYTILTEFVSMKVAVV